MAKVGQMPIYSKLCYDHMKKELTANKHGEYGEDFFCTSVGSHITKANTGKTGEGEV